MNPFYAFCFSFTKALFKLFYKHQVLGIENLPSGGAILAPNHVSFLDPPLVGISCNEEVHFLARGTLFKHQPFRFLIQHLNAIPLNSESPTHIMKKLHHLLLQGQKIVIFPEGHRSFNGTLDPLEKGVALLALKAKCPIIPVLIIGSYEVWPRTKLFPRLRGKTVCIFGKPLYPANYSQLDKKEAIEKMTLDLYKTLDSLKLIE